MILCCVVTKAEALLIVTLGNLKPALIFALPSEEIIAKLDIDPLAPSFSKSNHSDLIDHYRFSISDAGFH